MDPFTTFLLVAGGAEVAKGYLQYSASEDKMRAIDLEAAQQQIQLQQRQLATVDLIQRTTARQEAELATRGVSESSGSFRAIRENTYDIGSKELKNLDITKGLLEQNKDIEKRNVKDTLFSQLFGDASNGALTFAKLKGI